MSHAPMPGAEDLAEPLRSRWSPSIFDADHVLAEADVVRLLEAARWAPSTGNSQPWRFVVAPRGSAAHAAFVPHLSRGNAGWVPAASLVLVAGCEVVDVKDPDYARYDLGQAAAHVTLQARAMGLHAHQLAGFDKDGAAAALGVPDHVRLMSAIAIGVRGDPALVAERDREREQRVRRRLPLAEIVWWDRA
ncbi:nitroreductase family protein [Nocardioides dongxiaopingii]|uniref:nitroreductase family protein n=1 Tax=Nocardioides TaxID=1839 RepID=UPI001FEBB653|nr:MULTISPECIES: nitroreductase family protein [Nocardioides]